MPGWTRLLPTLVLAICALSACAAPAPVPIPPAPAGAHALVVVDVDGTLTPDVRAIRSVRAEAAAVL